ncbi:MAG TPA: tetratricopeptide repeat protein [bacterium]|jgi:tetratricopeptide (TPR) repeat protein
MRTFFRNSVMIAACLMVAAAMAQPTLPQHPKRGDAAANSEIMLIYADSLLKANPNDMTAWNIRVSGLMLLGRDAEARAALQEGLRIDSSDAGLQRLRQQIQEQSQHTNTVPDAKPPETKNQLTVEGTSAFAIGDMQEALTALDQALETRPKDAGLWRAKGETLQEMARHAEALTALEQAFALDSTLPDLHYDFACVNAALGDTARALRELEKALREDPPIKDLIKDKDCFQSLRSNPRFKKLVK